MTTAAISVTEATARGVAGLLRDAEHGEDVVVSRHGTPVAAVVSIERMQQIHDLESELRDVALVLTRAATDTGKRISLEAAIAAFGFDRAELEAELDAEAQVAKR